MFEVEPELEVGSVLEVEGTSVRVELSGDLNELSKTFNGRVYDIGQVGSMVKIHHGRQILLAYVNMLRMRSELEEEEGVREVRPQDDSRVLEADLFGEGVWLEGESRFRFHHGIRTYPLPGQTAYLTTRAELQSVYEGAQRARGSEDSTSAIKFGTYHGTNTECALDIDRLFGHHCAVLGATGSGKSAAVASLLHGISRLNHGDESSVCPRVVLIDPHGEYSKAFDGEATVYRAYGDTPSKSEDDSGIKELSLPYWLLDGEEFRDLVIGKTEHEATSENNIVRKALRHSRLVHRGWIEEAREWDGKPIGETEVDHPEDPRPVNDDEELKEKIGAYNRDTPDPFSLEEFARHIRQEQGMRRKRSKWQRESPSGFSSHRSVLDKLSVLRSDPRLGFLMDNFEEGDPDLPEILSQFVGDMGSQGDIRIIDISGIPNEVAGPLTASIARLIFEYKTWQTREERERDPVLVVCEEAHRYVPNRGEAQYEAAQRSIKRLAKEGRKYGVGLMLVSQRPADIEKTVISQCNSWVVLRLVNPTDQRHVARFLPDNFGGLVDLLPALGRREALVVGGAAAVPARITIRKLSPEQLPDSRDISFVSGWSSPPLSQEKLEEIVKRWRRSG